jgi:hypothetical protein
MKKFGIFLICSLLLGSVFMQGVHAGDQNDPEIEDLEDDVLLFGQMPAPFINRFVNHVDISSGWFFEDAEDPDTLFITLKVTGYKPCKLLVVYGVFWNFNGSSYAAFAMIARGEDFHVGIQIDETNFIEVADMYSINSDNNTITFAVPKDLIGDPLSGDVVENPFGIAAIRFVSDELANLMTRFVMSNILVADLTFNGLDYIIQY